MFVSCRTSEANYRQAYERAMEKRNSGIDSTQIELIEQQNIVLLKNAEGVKLPLQSRYVTVVKDGGGINESLKRYSVVVAEFKQLFNAKSMRERLADGAYPGAFVVKTASGDYLVLADSSDCAESVKASLDKVLVDKSLNLKKPLPWVLRRVGK